MASLAPKTTLTYTLSDGKSGSATITPGTWVGMERLYKKKIIDLAEELQSMEAIVRLLWFQIDRKSDFEDFYVTVVDIDLDVEGAEDEPGDTDPTLPSTSQEASPEQ